jgi:hypothetical protein
MSKYLDHPTVFQAAANVIKGSATTMIFTSAQPGGNAYANIAALALITNANMTSSNFTYSDLGAGNGVQLAVSAVSNMTPSANGNVAYVCITNGTNTYYAGTTVTTQAVTTAQTWNSPAFNITIADPT